MPRINDLMGDIALILNGLPDVFSTPQWGGRAYKLPGANGSLKKPKLLAFVSLTKTRDAINVVFKLPKEQSVEMVERYSWVGPFEFGKWHKSGWISATMTQKRQLKPLARLLGECRQLFPMESPESSSRRSKSANRGTNPIVRRLDRVMAEAKDEGWEPPEI
ncbi:MAG: hypothetical protein O7G85_01340 [Planctomycetota bacterium]|nr:hypothetical protein [Planctomycetota bacterium]